MKVLNVVYTNFELYYLSSVGYLLKLATPSIELYLLTTPGIATKINPELASLYTDVKTLDFSPSPSIRQPLTSVVKSRRFIRQLGQINVQADITCISSFREYYANIICRHLAGSSRLVAFRLANHECDLLCQMKRPLLSFYFNTFNHLFGASTLEYRWSSNTTFNYAYWFRHNPYHRIICISDWGHSKNGSEFRLPSPIVALRQLYGIKDHVDLERERTIMVAGERTPLFGMVDPSIQLLYDSILDFLRKEFSQFRLLFKPRPGLTDINKLKLDKFEILSPDIPFEELCLRNSYSKVISVKSTACKVAAYCGQPSYVLYPMFDIPSNLRKTLDSYHADIKSIIKVSDLNQLKEHPPHPPSFNIERLTNIYWKAVAG